MISSLGTIIICALLLLGLASCRHGVLAQIPDQADNVVRDQASIGAAGVHADQDAATGIEHETRSTAGTQSVT